MSTFKKGVSTLNISIFIKHIPLTGREFQKILESLVILA